jgi:Rieske 2Fe-2S family protein
MSERHPTDPTAGDFNGLRHLVDTLPSHWYFDPAHYERERSAIWTKQWVYLCRADTLADTRSFRTFDLVGQPILLLRDEAGEIRAFYNACRHRGAALCREPEGRLPASGISCPYHAWNYRLNGQLARIPNAGRPHHVPITETALHPIAVKVWRGFVYVNLAGTEATLGDNFNANLEQFDHWPLERLVVGHRLTKRIRCNWKVFWENYNECLHCPGVHPGLIDAVPIYRRGIMEERDDPNWRASADRDDPLYQGGLKRGAATWSVDGQSLGHEFADLTANERALGYHYMTSLPSHYLVLHVDHVRSSRILALGPEETELEIEWLFPPETLTDPTVDIMKACTFSATVMQEDGEVCELAQRGLHAAPHTHGMLMPEEYDVWRFQEWVRTSLGLV